MAIEREYGRPMVVHDGVTVAREIALEDQFENMGAELLIEAAENTNDKAGDGTTTAILLANAIVQEGMRQVNNGENPQIFKEELRAGSERVIEYLTKISRPVDTTEEVASVATIASTDPAIGKMVAHSFKQVGEDGAVTVDNGHSAETEAEVKEGLVIGKGYITPYFITGENLKCEINDTRVFVTDQDITGINDIFPVLKALTDAGGKKIFIVAANVTGQALGLLVQNKLQGNLNPLAIQAPGAGDRRYDILGDIAVSTGATIFSDKVGKKIADFALGDLGAADKVIADKNETVIIGGRGTIKGVKERVYRIKTEIEEAEGEFEKETLRERLAKLAGGIAVIYAGGSSETEVRDKRLRIEDAINAAKAAMAEGVIPGGGVAMYHARSVLTDKTIGDRILKRVLAEPVRRLLENAGAKPEEVLPHLDPASPEMIYNVVTNQMGNAYNMGVVDPLRVARMALENAVSVASMILTTDATVGIVKEEDDTAKARGIR